MADIKIYSCAADDRYTAFTCRCGQKVGYSSRDGWGFYANGKPVCSWKCQRKYEHCLSKKDCGGDYTMMDAYMLWSESGIQNAVDALKMIVDKYGQAWLDTKSDFVGWHPDLPGAEADTLLALITPPKVRTNHQQELIDNYRAVRKYHENHHMPYQRTASVG